MANRTLIKGAEVALPTTVGTASSFGSATMVRLVNTHATAAYKVTLLEDTGAAGIGSFTMPAQSVEYIEKNSVHALLADNAAILGAKVGFTN